MLRPDGVDLGLLRNVLGILYRQAPVTSDRQVVLGIAAAIDDHLLGDILNNTALKQKYYADYDLEVCSYYKDVMRQYQKIPKEKLAYLLDEYDLIEELCEPHDLLPAEKEVIWHLLTTKNWYNLPMLYNYNPSYFWSLYKKWPDAMQTWVNIILK